MKTIIAIVVAHVACAVDGAWRAQCVVLHSSGHLIDAAMARCGYRETLVATKGYHFPDGPYVEYLGNVEPEKRDALVATLQREFAAVVGEDTRTTIEMMPRETAERELNRTAQNFDFSMFPEPTIRIFGCAGCLGPCGGTHVRSTADLGEYTVTGLRVKKGVVRVKYGRKGKEAK